MFCQCKAKMKYVSGPDIHKVMFDREPHKPIEEECPKCGKEYSIILFPKPIIHQRQYGTA